jgi:hypothetical protein
MRPFDEENHLSQDDCALLARTLVNKSIADYTLFNNFFTANCKGGQTEKISEFMTNNPNLHYRDGYGFASSCGVDNDSELRNNSKMTHDREKIALCTRWYTAVPDLGRGGLIPNIESRLKYNEDTSDLRDCDRVTEKDFNRFIPLPKCMADNVQNPEHIVEKWTRGGDFTRDYVRSDGYLEKCGFYSDGKVWRRQ